MDTLLMLGCTFDWAVRLMNDLFAFCNNFSATPKYPTKSFDFATQWATQLQIARSNSCRVFTATTLSRKL
jgi:hypothetical protein